MESVVWWLSILTDEFRDALQLKDKPREKGADFEHRHKIPRLQS